MSALVSIDIGADTGASLGCSFFAGGEGVVFIVALDIVAAEDAVDTFGQQGDSIL